MGSREDDEYWNQKYSYDEGPDWCDECGLELDDNGQCEDCGNG